MGAFFEGVASANELEKMCKEETCETFKLLCNEKKSPYYPFLEWKLNK